jgi:hypothetical protein
MWYAMRWFSAQQHCKLYQIVIAAAVEGDDKGGGGFWLLLEAMSSFLRNSKMSGATGGRMEQLVQLVDHFRNWVLGEYA